MALGGGTDATANLRLEAARHGVEPARLVFAAHRPQAEHLARYRLADLALDSFPYTGHTTTSDALWMGAPVLTTRGETFASSVAASLLHAGGLPETVTCSFAEYEERAVRLAGEPATLAAYRRRLEAGAHGAPVRQPALHAASGARLPDHVGPPRGLPAAGSLYGGAVMIPPS